MSTPWTPDYGLYRWAMNGDPAIVTVDMNALAHEPDAERSALVLVHVPLQDPDDQGMRTRAEAVVVDRLGDRLTTTLEDDRGAWFVGQYASGGSVVFAYYGRPGCADGLDAGDDWAPYALTVVERDDAPWAFLRNVLAPDAAQFEAIYEARAEQASRN